MRYVLVNKPFEVLTQFTDENGRTTLKEFVSVPGIYPVGRLDYDSEGLVLLTDDKPLQHRLADPRFKVPKTYLVQVDGELTEEALEKLRRGVQIKDGFTTPAQVELLSIPPSLWERSKPIRFRANIPTSWLRITISQGMNRQVRKMTAAVGFPTLRLVRTQIAHLGLGDLAPGQWRELTAEEAKKLKAAFSATKQPAQRPALTKKGATDVTPSEKPTARKPAGARPGGPKTSGGQPGSGSRPPRGQSSSRRPR